MGEKTGSEHTHAAPARQAAANDSRWRLVAGFAGFAAVASVAFGGWQAQRAASTDAQLAALQASNAGVVTAAARPKATAEQIVLVNGEPHVMVRDPRLAELVAQHRQLGGGVHHTQAGFFRASTIEPGLR